MFVYVIYDVETFDVWFSTASELECIEVYNDLFDGFVNISWVALNLGDWLKCLN